MLNNAWEGNKIPVLTLCGPESHLYIITTITLLFEYTKKKRETYISLQKLYIIYTLSSGSKLVWLLYQWTDDDEKWVQKMWLLTFFKISFMIHRNKKLIQVRNNKIRGFCFWLKCPTNNVYIRHRSLCHFFSS